jgi:SAM-dependent methyltransferase
MPVKIRTELTAKDRGDIPSSPCKDLYENTLYLPEECEVLDYGCGFGNDVTFLEGRGYKVRGYDPNFVQYSEKPDISEKYELIMCNYVLDVLDKRVDRTNAISFMWDRVAYNGCLSLSVNSKEYIESVKKKDGKDWVVHRDGWLTKQNYFIRGFNENELMLLIYNLPHVAAIESPVHSESNTTTIRILKRKEPLLQDVMFGRG